MLPVRTSKKSASDDDERTPIYATYNSGETVRGQARTLIEVSLHFISVNCLVRGAHMIPAFDSNKSTARFLNDLIDEGIFLRGLK
jgi:hypothetical protein